MLRRPPTAIELKLDDIIEFEQHRRKTFSRSMKLSPKAKQRFTTGSAIIQANQIIHKGTVPECKYIRPFSAHTAVHKGHRTRENSVEFVRDLDFLLIEGFTIPILVKWSVVDAKSKAQAKKPSNWQQLLNLCM
ncbi:hypothetical protein HUJ05_009798 [Dendroctonus ponderosae]|nr:hypothetical protein HUJ05_009798 [Dendroctonus ponderosae]